MPYYPEAIRQACDEIGAREDDFEQGQALRNEIPREFIKKYLDPTDVILDAGGTGLNAILIAQLGTRVTLLDLSPAFWNWLPASIPTLVDSWEQNAYAVEQWQKLKALELKVCQVPELLGVGRHLLCIARKV